jgi:N-acetylmuramoyl-L-alanine amidase
MAGPALALDKTRRTDFAIWDPITDRSTTALTPRRVTMHIAVSNSTDIYGPNKIEGTYAHFYNPRSGSPRQHQTMDRRAVADADGNGTTISVEHQGMPGDSMTGVQMTNLAKIFAWAHVFCGVPNRIATVDNLNGLAWHRLGISGNFGEYDPKFRTTWSRAQTGAVWSNSAGKTCPTNNFIHALPEIYSRAQIWINFYRNPPPD